MMPRRVSPFSFCVLSFALGFSAVAADAVLPSPLPPARYDGMRKKSPFAPATAAATSVPAPGFAIDWYVSGLAKIGDKDFVTIQSRDGQKRFSLWTGETGPEGITLNKIDWAPEITKSKVVVKKGAEIASLEFDQAAAARVAPAIPAALSQPPRGQPGAVPMRGPAMPFPQGGQQFPPQNRQGPGQPEQRRRIRIINSPTQ